MANDIWVRKTGRVVQLYEVPFTDYDNPPEGCPQTDNVESIAQLQARFPGRTLHVIERAPRKEPQNAQESTPEQRLKAIAALGLSEDAKAALMAKERTPQPALAQVRESVEFQDKMLQEFRLVLASIGNAYSKEEAEAIGNFVLAVDPSLEPELIKAKLTLTTRRFTL